MVVEFLDELGEAELDEGLARNLVVMLGEKVAPFTGDRLVGGGSCFSLVRWEHFCVTYTSYWNVFLYF